MESDDEIYSSSLPSRRVAEDVAYQNDRDLALALALEEQLNKSVRQQELKILDSLRVMTSMGKALAFTQEIVDKRESLIAPCHQNENTTRLCSMFSLVNPDDMLLFAEKMLLRQEEYTRIGRDTRVDIGYYFTQSVGSNRFRVGNLKTFGGKFGDGVYTANNPFVANETTKDADTVIMLARLKGAVDDFGGDRGAGTHDTFLKKVGAFNEICVLTRSSHCVPLIQFDISVVDVKDDISDGNDLVYHYHCRFQSIIDHFFNTDKSKTFVTRTFPSQANERKSTDLRITDKQRTLSTTNLQSSDPFIAITTNHQSTESRIPRQIISATNSLKQVLQYIVHYTAPDFVDDANRIPSEVDLYHELSADHSSGSNCQLCRQSLRSHGKVGRVPRCLHEFHIRCLAKRLNCSSNKCPTCNVDIGHVSKSLMLVAPSSKPSSLIIEDEVALLQQRRLSGLERDRRHCSASMTYVSIVQSNNAEKNVSGSRFTLAYACGSTFDVTLVPQMRNEAISQKPSSMFENSVFLQRLLLRAQEHRKKCASCGNVTETTEETMTIGVMPTGTMRVAEIPELACTGCDSGSFLISYMIQNGTQKNYNECPGQPHNSAFRRAYVPNNEQGRNLLKRLQFAFSHGMTFKVGTSISTGQPNSVTWSSIAHKTSPTYGPFGYPDSKYFKAANEDLDALGIPAADVL